MLSKEGSPRLFITPYFGGMALSGEEEVAGDGLSVISIKQSHRKCQITSGSNSKKPQISCAQGIKARNSFRNLFKPDLGKLKDMECATRASMTQLLKTHNLENPAKPTYKNRILRILGSLVKNKKKAVMQSDALEQNTSPFLPTETCVLLSICPSVQGKEMNQNNRVQSREDCSVPLNAAITNTNAVQDQNLSFLTDNIEMVSNSCHLSAVTIYGTLSSPSSMRINTSASDNTLMSTEIIQGTLSNIPFGLNPNENKQNAACQQSGDIEPKETSSFQLKRITSQVVIPVSVIENGLTQICSSDENETFMTGTLLETESFSLRNDFNIDDFKTSTSTENINQFKKQAGATFDGGKGHVERITGINNVLSKDGACATPSNEVVQSIFKDILTEMQEIEDYISSYVSSFCVLEEEFQNYPALTKKSSEVVSYFFEQVHNSNKVKTEPHKTDSVKNTTSKEVNNTLYITAIESGALASNNENVYEINDTIIIQPRMEIKDLKPTENKVIPDKCVGYCYWDDMNVTNSFNNEEIFFGPSSNETSLTCKDNEFENNDNSLVPLHFFEDVWRQLSGNISRDTFAYNTWSSVYEENILTEAQVVLESIDVFLENECFPSPSPIINHPMNCCTIIEIDDSYSQQNLITISQDIPGENNFGNMQKDINCNDQYSINESLYRDLFDYENLTDNPDLGYNININEEFTTGNNYLNESVDETELNDMNDKIKNVNSQLRINTSPSFLKNNQNIPHSNKQPQMDHMPSLNFETLISNNCQEYEVEISRNEESKIYDKLTTKMSYHDVKNLSNVGPTEVAKPLPLPIATNENSPVKMSAFLENSGKELNAPLNENPNLFFSSPHLQLNLTNPLLDYNKK